VGILGKTCCSCKTKEHQQQRENQITKIHKQTTKQVEENQIINTQTNKTIKTWVSRHNLVVLIMGVCTIRSKAWNKDIFGRREYVRREMCNLKKKWVIGKIKWYTVGIKSSVSALYLYYLSS